MNDVDFVMTDHPAWIPAGRGGGKVRVLVTFGGRWLVQTGGPIGFTLRELESAAFKPFYNVFSLPPDALSEMPQLATSLAGLGAVARFRAGNLWDAVGTAAIRQVLREAHGAKLYRQFCQAHGERLGLPTGDDYWLFPTPEAVLDLTPDQFAAVGLASKRQVLRDAANSYLRDGREWQSLSPLQLVEQLRRIPRVGQWTAHAAVADWSNDWTLYPPGDLTLRTWARRAAPDYPWPTDERAFANFWRVLTRTDLGVITILTLAWGNRHADTA
jgi:DNA-3-methyladenine glycosylase II